MRTGCAGKSASRSSPLVRWLACCCAGTCRFVASVSHKGGAHACDGGVAASSIVQCLHDCQRCQHVCWQTCQLVVVQVPVARFTMSVCGRVQWLCAGLRAWGAYRKRKDDNEANTFEGSPVSWLLPRCLLCTWHCEPCAPGMLAMSARHSVQACQTSRSRLEDARRQTSQCVVVQVPAVAASERMCVAKGTV